MCTTIRLVTEEVLPLFYYIFIFYFFFKKLFLKGKFHRRLGNLSKMEFYQKEKLFWEYGQSSFQML